MGAASTGNRGPNIVVALGLRARFFFAFLGIAAFSALAAVAGSYVFNVVGARLAAIEQSVPATRAATSLSQSVGRIVAAAPALIDAPDHARRQAAREQLVDGLARLEVNLDSWRHDEAIGFADLAPHAVVSALRNDLDEIERNVEQRLSFDEFVANARREASRAGVEIDRLLAPWLDILDQSIDRSIDRMSNGRLHGIADAAGPGGTDEASVLDGDLTMRTQVLEADRSVQGIVLQLLHAAVAQSRRESVVLDFQLERDLAVLTLATTRLDERLQSLLDPPVGTLRRLATGPASIGVARRRSLEQSDKAEQLLDDARARSISLVGSVERFGDLAGTTISAAIADAQRVQRDGMRTLLALAMASLVASTLIVWLYVDRRLARRLAALAGEMFTIAGVSDSRSTPGPADEIDAMSAALDVLKQNTQQRDGLLRERTQAAYRLEQEVEQRTAELQRALQAQSRILTVASHDLRQPMHALGLFVAQLRHAEQARDSARLVERIETSVEAMNALFDALLDLSQLDSGVLQPTPGVFSIARVLEHVDATFMPLAVERALNFRVTMSDVQVVSDPVLLERIVFNLVSNAIRYTATGSVHVGCRRRGGSLSIEVRDSGPGIPDEQREHIFDEFRRAAPPPADGTTALGLGLAIVVRLARLLDTSIDLASAPGRGSRFSVRVPLASIDRSLVG